MQGRRASGREGEQHGVEWTTRSCKHRSTWKMNLGAGGQLGGDQALCSPGSQGEWEQEVWGCAFLMGA